MNFSSIIAAGLMGLATLATSHEGFNVKFRPVAPLATPVRAIEINRIVITDGQAKGFNQFVARKSTTFERGKAISIYFEPLNLGTRFEDGAVRAHLTIDLQLLDGDGKLLDERKKAWELPIVVKSDSHLPLTQVYVSLQTPTINASEGSYRARLRIHDDVAGRFIDQEVAFSIGNEGASPEVGQSDVRQPEVERQRPANTSDKVAKVEVGIGADDSQHLR